VNNAAITACHPFLDMTEAQRERILRINLTGTFIVTPLPGRVAAQWGRIIDIASSAVQAGAKNMAHHAACKGGVIVLTRTVAVGLGPGGITAT